MTLLVLLNRGGGSRLDPDAIAEALASAGVSASVETVDGGGIAERAGALAKRGARELAVAGGDGSISAAAGALAGTDTALAVIPGGTLNHFARDLGIPADLAEAAAVVAGGHRRKVDLARVNDRIFINNSAVGLYPLMVVDRDLQQHRLGRSKRLAMLVASVRTLMNFHDRRLTLTVNDSEEGQLDTPLLFVGNNDYALELPAAGTREALDDGRLCVLVMRKKGAPGLVAAALRALVGLTRADDMIRLDDVRRLRVATAAGRLSVSIDGETCTLDTPLDYRILPGALTVVAPAR